MDPWPSVEPWGSPQKYGFTSRPKRTRAACGYADYWICSTMCRTDSCGAEHRVRSRLIPTPRVTKRVHSRVISASPAFMRGPHRDPQSQSNGRPRKRSIPRRDTIRIRTIRPRTCGADPRPPNALGTRQTPRRRAHAHTHMPRVGTGCLATVSCAQMHDTRSILLKFPRPTAT